MTKKSIINISSNSRRAIIDIEGTIGIPEGWQFDNDENKIATYQRFRDKLEQIKELDTQSIIINIRSLGGNVNDALLIHDALCGTDAMIETHCYGYVASAATIIAQAASKGLRYVSSSCFYLIHNSIATLEGNREQVLEASELLAKTDRSIAQIYAMRSSRSVEEIELLMNDNRGEGRWLSAQEVLDNGLADNIENVSAMSKMGNKVRNFFQTILMPENEAILDLAQMDVDIIQNQAKQIKQLNNSIEELKRENQKLKIRPSTTASIEDPDTIGYVDKNLNESAYEIDVQSFG